MAVMVHEMPEDERPTERLIKDGVDALSDAALLAILLRTGTKEESVLDLAQQVLAMYDGRGLIGVMEMAPSELAAIKGIGLAKAASIVAAVELGRRIATKASRKNTHISSPKDVAIYAMPHFRYELREHFAVMMLNMKNGVIAMPDISIGSLSASVVHPREVFRAATRYAAASIILLHNHPSGDPHPSFEDLEVTKRIIKAGHVMDIPVLDHVILGDNSFVSLKEEGKGGF